MTLAMDLKKKREKMRKKWKNLSVLHNGLEIAWWAYLSVE